MGKRILVIEDNEDDLIILKRYLNKAGYTEIEVANTAEEGIRLAKQNKPDIVISDTLLPGSDGFEVCLKIKEHFGGLSPKVIIMTGSIDAVDAVKARKVGADDYCAKTSDCGPLLEALKRLS